MILGVDHLALSCLDLQAGATVLEGLGYDLKFTSAEVSNPQEKRRFLAQYRATHGIAFAQRSGSVALELTAHGLSHAGIQGPFQPCMEQAPPGLVPVSPQPHLQGVWKEAFGLEAVLGWWPDFDSLVWYRHEASPSGGLQSVLLLTPSLEASADFYMDGLRCIERRRGVSPLPWRRLAFSSPLPTWSLDLLLVEVPDGAVETHLDAPGFPCLALLTNRLPEDLEQARQAGGHDISDTFELQPHERRLKIALLRGPANEIIELIQP